MANITRIVVESQISGSIPDRVNFIESVLP